MAATPNTRAEQERLTRAAIIAAARNLFDRLGYTATSADAIARHAGISRATFYLHFRSKAEVVVELMLEREPDIASAYRALDALRDPTHADVVAWIEDHATLWRTHRMEFAAMEQALATRQPSRTNGSPCTTAPTTWGSPPCRARPGTRSGHSCGPT